MNDAQERVIKLLKQRTPDEKLKKWVKGRIPSHYKRLTVEKNKAVELAAQGASASMAYFGKALYFTQALIVGAALSGEYDHLVIVTPSQYGKSWTLGQLALMLANRNEPVYVAGADTSTTSIIMNKVFDHIQDADREIKDKYLETNDKLEKLQASLSKTKLAFKGGGRIEGMSLGETFSNAKKGNKAIGNAGHILADEASMISDDAFAELGRREFSRDDGKKFLSIEISNPHNPGRFFDTLVDPDLAPGTLVIWMDALTALEEGRFKSEDQIRYSEFFKNKSTCTRYLLCELEDYSEHSIFPEPVVTDYPVDNSSTWYMGVDGAYKGKDKIEVVLGTLTAEHGVIAAHRAVIDKTVLSPELIAQGVTWEDGVTGDLVCRQIRNYIIAYNVRYVCVDSGYGMLIIERLIQMCPGVRIVGVEFGSRTTPLRREAKHYSAVYGDNKRAEMHLDVQNLMDEKRMYYTEEVKDAVKDQMRAIKAVRKPTGKTAIVAKSEIKKLLGRSPDTVDSLLLMVHAIILDTLGDTTFIYGEG